MTEAAAGNDTSPSPQSLSNLLFSKQIRVQAAVVHEKIHSSLQITFHLQVKYDLFSHLTWGFRDLLLLL